MEFSESRTTNQPTQEQRDRWHYMAGCADEVEMTFKALRQQCKKAFRERISRGPCCPNATSDDPQAVEQSFEKEQVLRERIIETLATRELVYSKAEHEHEAVVVPISELAEAEVA